MMNYLVKYQSDFGRSGVLRGFFVCTSAQWDFLQDFIKSGRYIYWGEVLGKHSNVSGPLEDTDINIISDNQNFIDDFVRVVGKSFGHDPLARIQDGDI